MMVPKMMLTKKQMQVVNDFVSERPRILVLHGAMRSGKTFLIVFLFLMMVFSNHGRGRIFIIGGATQSTITLNVLTIIEEMLDIQIKKDSTNSFWLWGNRIVCFGGSDASSWKSVRGFTASGALLNEGTALHDSFIKEVITRCSEYGSRVLMDTNPDNPLHPVNVDYIQKAGQRLKNGRKNISAYQFTLFDNDRLDPEYVESIVMSTPPGMYTQRNIYGEWTSPGGIIYDMFSTERCVVTSEPRAYSRYHISVDYGTQNPMTFGLWGLFSGIWYKCKEYHYDGRERGVQKTDVEYYDDLVEFADGLNVSSVIIDPSASSFIAMIRKNSRFTVKKGNNAVAEGIRNTASALHSGRIKICDCCAHTIREFGLYVYDEAARQRGEDVPLKVNDHHMDDTRYFVNTILRREGSTAWH